MVGSGAAFSASPFSRRCRALLGFGDDSGTQENLAHLLHVSADAACNYSIRLRMAVQKSANFEVPKKQGVPKPVLAFVSNDCKQDLKS